MTNTDEPIRGRVGRMMPGEGLYCYFYPLLDEILKKKKGHGLRVIPTSPLTTVYRFLYKRGVLRLGSVAEDGALGEEG